MRTTGVLIVLALAHFLLHLFTNGQYGFHRDELATLDDARRLAWGYVAYPPVTPFFGRLSLEFFGASVAGARFFPALASAVAVVFSGLMAREIGGKQAAQVTAAVAVAIAPVALGSGALLQYVTFDFLWWVLAAYFTARLIATENPRWWLAIGLAIGLGVMTKYTMGFLVAGLAAGVVFTPARRWMRGPWLWAGAGMSFLIFLPHLVWQAQHGFITLEFLNNIHARDIRIGRTSGFLMEQFFIGANPITIPLWAAGLVFLFRSKQGARFRALGWMFVVPFLLFIFAKGRGYYMAPGYPILLAAGAVWAERWLAFMNQDKARAVRGMSCSVAGLGAALSISVVIPIFPVGSAAWHAADRINGNWREEIGWPELASTVAAIRDSLPEADRARMGILAGNYGEAGAINLYGATHGLPRAIAGTNSYWYQGYGDPPPEVVIALGFSRQFLERNFESCELAGHITNPYGVRNEETEDHPEIFVCRRMRGSWADFWKKFQRFG